MRIKLLFSLLLIAFITVSVFAEDNRKIDSLENLLVIEKDKLIKIDILNILFDEQYNTDSEKALNYAMQGLRISQSLDKDEIVVKNRISQSANNVGAGYLLVDNYEKSLQYLLLALKTAEGIKDTVRMSNALYNLSIVYEFKGEDVLALKYIEQSIELDEKSGDLEAAAYGYSSLAADYFFKSDYNKGMVYYAKAMKIIIPLNDKGLMSTLYGNRAVGLKYAHRYIEAIKYLNLAIEIDKDLNNRNGLETDYLNLADVYISLNDNEKAIEFNLKSLAIAKEINSAKSVMKAYQGLAESYEQMGNKSEAYKYIQLYANWKDTLYEEQNATAMAEMQTKYETDKKEAQNTLLIAGKKLDKAKLEKKAIQQKMLLALLGLVLVIVFYVIYSLSQKKKINKILNAQNEEIVLKNEIIEDKNKDITDSINYAQRIQESILSEVSILKNNYESFVYYLPKDIVSGDFYWFKEIDDKLFFSVVDCTGHGVPGAFMSIIGANSLNKIVEDLRLQSPGEILDKLNQFVNEALVLKGNADKRTMRDGMDISICVIDKKNQKLEYAGANNPLYLLRNSSEKLERLNPILESDDSLFYEVKANKMAIGGGTNAKKYVTHSIDLKKRDTIYLFSDGYADQFGGKKGKKFMYKPFKRMFLSIQEEPMEKQLTYIDKAMRKWKGELDQLDDICIVGVRI
jgi:serine phosphatase RsbU (regulator of sigma subunit)/tetratricopeptide (TPR) repeat protein